MRTHRELMQLAETFRDQQLLTVYLHTTVANPADRHRWHAQLEQALHALRGQTATASHAERSALEDAIRQLKAWLETPAAASHAPGLLVVVDAHEVRIALPLDTVVATLATWQRGVLLAPLLREVSRGESAAVMVADARRVHLYRFSPPRHIERLETLESHAELDVERHLGGANAGFHPGTRGGTASDEVDRHLLALRDRLYAEAIVRAHDVVGKEGWIVLAGNTRAVTALGALVPRPSAQRVLVVDGIDMHASPTEIAQAVAAVTVSRADQLDVELVRGLMEEQGTRGRAVAGLRATRAMLDREGVADLVLSERFVELYPADADDMLRHAFHQGALVREVHGAAALEIDERAEGVVARLRYALPTSDN